MSVLKRYTDSGWAEVGGASILTQPSAPANPVDGQLWIDSSTVGVGNIGVVDLTNATSDYLLQIGETAIITYTSATSVPLHISTSSGLYEITISGGDYSVAGTNNNVHLYPNNTTYTSKVERMVLLWETSTGATKYTATEDSFLIGSGIILSNKATINTTSSCKTLQNITHQKQASAIVTQIYTSYWTDTTAWSSIGTIVFGTAQSGKIVIRRIA